MRYSISLTLGPLSMLRWLRCVPATDCSAWALTEVSNRMYSAMAVICHSILAISNGREVMVVQCKLRHGLSSWRLVAKLCDIDSILGTSIIQLVLSYVTNKTKYTPQSPRYRRQQRLRLKIKTFRKVRIVPNLRAIDVMRPCCEFDASWPIGDGWPVVKVDEYTDVYLDGPSRIPSRWAPSSHRIKPYTKNLPYAHLCAQRGRRQVAVLVFPQVRRSYRRTGLMFICLFIRQLKKVKKASGEIIGVNVVCIPCSRSSGRRNGIANGSLNHRMPLCTHF